MSGFIKFLGIVAFIGLIGVVLEFVIDFIVDHLNSK